jgi:SAM-dependent methyltransferase
MTGSVKLDAFVAAISTILTNSLLAPGARPAVARILRAHVPTDGRVLDVGCGTRPWVQHSGLVGIDLNPAAVHSFARRANALVGDAVSLPFRDGSFSATMSVGLLHHLTDQQARSAVEEMRRVTAPGGTIVVFDGILPSAARRYRLAALIRALDRGAHMRQADDLAALLAAAARWKMSIMTYASTGLEAMVAVHIKPNA